MTIESIIKMKDFGEEASRVGRNSEAGANPTMVKVVGAKI